MVLAKRNKPVLAIQPYDIIADVLAKKLGNAFDKIATAEISETTWNFWCSNKPGNARNASRQARFFQGTILEQIVDLSAEEIHNGRWDGEFVFVYDTYASIINGILHNLGNDGCHNARWVRVDGGFQPCYDESGDFDDDCPVELMAFDWELALCTPDDEGFCSEGAENYNIIGGRCVDEGDGVLQCWKTCDNFDDDFPACL